VLGGLHLGSNGFVSYMPAVEVGNGYCGKYYELSKTDSIASCFQAASGNANCVSSDLVVNYGQGSRAGRCLCSCQKNCKTHHTSGAAVPGADCVLGGLHLGSNGFVGYMLPVPERHQTITPENDGHSISPSKDVQKESPQKDDQTTTPNKDAQQPDVLSVVQQEDVLPIYLLAGQSNMRGYGAERQTTGASPEGTLEYAGQQSTKLAAVLEQLWACDSTAPVELDDIKVVAYTNIAKDTAPACVDALSAETQETLATSKKDGFAFFGPELGFGFGMHNAKLSKQMLILKTAKGGTTLGWDWLPPSRRTEALCKDMKSAGVKKYKDVKCEEFTKLGWGELYDKMMEKVELYMNPEELTKVMPSLRAVKPVFVGFGWFQGTSDYYDAMADFYKDNLVSLIQDVRSGVSKPNLPVVVAACGHFGDGQDSAEPPGLRTVQEAQLAATTTLHDAITVDTRPLWRNYGATAKSSQWIHYYWNGEEEFFVGQGLAHGMAGLIYGMQEDVIKKQWQACTTAFADAAEDALAPTNMTLDDLPATIRPSSSC